jgi:hypothetical protein
MFLFIYKIPYYDPIYAEKPLVISRKILSNFKEHLKESCHECGIFGQAYKARVLLLTWETVGLKHG